MAVLTSGGIIFGDSTVANSRADLFGPAGTTCLFFRSAAPTFWTQVTTQNDKALRIVSSGGGGAGGNVSFLSAFASRAASANIPVSIAGLTVQPTTLSINQIAVHAHPANIGGNIGASSGGVTCVAPGGSTGNNGGGGAHNHPAGVSAANGPWSSSIDMRVQYIDIIICSFDG